MSALFSHASESTKWRTIAIFVLGFWLSSSLVLDFIVMPGLYATGMMQAANFAIAGYSIFWLFNHLELLCASVVLTGVLVLWQASPKRLISRRMLTVAAVLVAIPLLYTYVCTPVMAQLGMTLDWFSPTAAVPEQMTQMHSAYFGLELVKLSLAAVLLRSLYGDRPEEEAEHPSKSGWVH